MKKCLKISALALGIIAGMSLPIAFAGWFGGGSIIKPGSHVIDMARLNDSIKVLAARAATFTNRTVQLANKITMASIVDGSFKKSLDDYSKLGNLNLGTTTIASNPDSYDTSAFYKSWTVTEAVTGSDLLQPVLIAQSNTNKDSMTITSASIIAQGKIDNAVKEINNTSSSGLNSEKQKLNATEILTAQSTINRAKTSGGNLAAKIAADEGAFAKNRLDQAQSKTSTFSGYDPYHPNDYDKEHHKSTSVNFGFKDFGQ